MANTTSTRLNQIVAIEKGVKTSTQKEMNEHFNLLSKTSLVNGISRVYRPFVDEPKAQRPPESTLVQVKASEVIAAATETLSRLFDVTATKDWANTVARADVVVNGKTIVKQAPVTYLLFLEKELAGVADLVRKLPTLDPTEEWVFDSNNLVHRTSPVKTLSTKKIPKNHIKAEATDKHAAQVEVYMEDENVGVWETTKSSGALKISDVKAILNRINNLSIAVKQAREEANSVIAENVHVGAAIFSYIFE